MNWIWYEVLVDKVEESWAKLNSHSQETLMTEQRGSAFPPPSLPYTCRITSEVFWVSGICHGDPPAEGECHQPTSEDFCVERQYPTCESHFKMHFEVWANNVNDIQWDCQMLVIYSHFRINVGPPVMNWKLNKHISFN